MPYIKKEDRAELDPIIDALAEKIVEQSMFDKVFEHEAAFAGQLNYVFTRLALKVIKLKFGKMRYWIVNTVVGVFQCASAEFYRRAGEPYEDIQILKNGDVDLYAEFDKQLEGKPE